MNFSFRRLASLLVKRLLQTLLVAAVLFGGCVFIVHQQSRPPYEWELKNRHSDLTERANAIAATYASKALFLPGPRHADFEKLIPEVYPVGYLQFVNDGLIRITFAQDVPDKNGFCQAIANLWSSKNRVQDVCVQAWEGDHCIAMASVTGGRLINITP